MNNYMKRILKSLALMLGMLMVPIIANAEEIYGDVNGDQEVNIADVNSIIGVILDGNDFTPAADVNGDGEINIVDVNSIINIILGEGVPYFAWGETAPKDYYDWSTYKWCKGSYNTMTKYCTNSSYGYNGFTDGKTELDPEDDAAWFNWGSSWRMPTEEQLNELINICTWTWTQQNGVNGRLVTGPNGNTIFLPAAGGRWDESLDSVGSSGYYWTRTSDFFDSYFSDYACSLGFFHSGYVGCDCDSRDYGFTVRAVRVSQN